VGLDHHPCLGWEETESLLYEAAADAL